MNILQTSKRFHQVGKGPGLFLMVENILGPKSIVYFSLVGRWKGYPYLAKWITILID